MSDRVLIVASAEESREPAFLISKFLASNGYSASTCLSDDADSDVKADVSLDEETSLGGFDAVVFLDDGGDEAAAGRLAENASKKGLVMGGFSAAGCAVLAGAGALKDEFVCSGLPDDFYEGTKERVDSPSVRSDKVVTGAGDCAQGFGVVLVDALGGKVKKIIHGEGDQAEALVIADIASWPRWWPLARSLSSKGVTLGVARWSDVDVSAGRVANVVVMSPERNAVSLGDMPLPRSVLVREGGIEAVRRLEAVGCRNVNSSRAIEALSRADVAGDAATLLGKEAALSVDSLMREGAVAAPPGGRIVGRGDMALVTSDGVEYRIVGPSEVMGAARNLGARPPRGGERVLLRREAAGWVASSSSGEAAAVAARTALVAHAMAGDPNDLGEMEVTVSAEATVPVSVSALPGGEHDVSDSMARNVEDDMLRFYLERELGEEGIFLQPDKRLVIRGPRGSRAMEAEDALSHFVDMGRRALRREIDALEAGREPDPWDERASRRHRHVLRCLLGMLSENGILPGLGPKVATAALKVAYQYGRSVGGINFGLAGDLAMEARHWRWSVDEDDDILSRYSQPTNYGAGQGEPGKSFYRSLTRYNPEYTDQKMGDKTKWGVYYVWEEPRRDPWLWDKRYVDGVYPMNKSLKP
jgi:hypothetical protein